MDTRWLSVSYQCKEWYHTSCVKIPRTYIDNQKKWNCGRCIIDVFFSLSCVEIMSWGTYFSMEGDHFLLPILVREGDHNLLGGLYLAANFGPGD